LILDPIHVPAQQAAQLDCRRIGWGEAILDLRSRARGKGWGMRLFHDKLLGAGSLPPKLLARETGLDS